MALQTDTQSDRQKVKQTDRRMDKQTHQTHLYLHRGLKIKIFATKMKY